MDTSKTAPWKLVSAADEALRSFSIDGDGKGYRQLVDSEFEENPEMIVAGSYEDWKALKKEFTIDPAFSAGIKKKTIGERKLTLDMLVADIRSGKLQKHTAILGSAGTGKTTILKRVGRDVRGRGSVGERGNKLVIMLDFRKTPENELISPMKAILSRMFTTYKESDMIKAFNWLIRNQKEFIFLLDSLDTMPFSLKEEHRRIDYKTKETSDIILYNLLSGNFFSETIIVSSSREIKVVDLPPVIQPQICILLDGFTQQSVRNVTKRLIGDKLGTKLLEYIEHNCPDIEPLLSTPAFLVYSLIAFQQKDGFKPSSMTGVLLRIVLNYAFSLGADKTIVRPTLEKLMPMAYDGILQQRVLFTPEDLKRSKISIRELNTLSLLIPQDQAIRLPSRLLVNEQNYTYFNHQSGQEFLAGMHSASMTPDEFQRFVKDKLKEPDLSVVKKALFGIMLDKNVFEASKDLNHVDASDEKRRILLEILEEQWKEAKSSFDRLDWFDNIQECRDGATALIKALVKEVDVNGVKLSESDMHALAFIINSSISLEIVDVSDCDLDSSKFRTLMITIGKSPAECCKLRVDENPSAGAAGFSHVGKLVEVCRVQKLSARGCSIDSKCVDNFLASSANTEMKLIDVSLNPVLSVYDLFRLGERAEEVKYEFAKNMSLSLQSNKSGTNTQPIRFSLICKDGLRAEDMFRFGRWAGGILVSYLLLANCKLNSSLILKLLNGIDGLKIRSVDMSNNTRMGTVGMFALGKLADISEAKKLVVSNCNLSEKQIRNFLDGCCNVQLHHLDLSDKRNHPRFTPLLGNLLVHVRDELNLIGWVFSLDEQKYLQRQLNSLPTSTNLRIMMTIKGVDETITQTSSSPPSITSCSNIAAETAGGVVKTGTENMPSDEVKPLQILEPRKTMPPRFFPQRLCHPIQKEATVDKSGGIVDITKRCSVWFPRNAVLDRTKFKFALDNYISASNEGDFVVTPTLSCSPSARFSRNVSVRLPLWCSKKSHNGLVYVAVYDERTGQQTIAQFALEEQCDFIEFDCPHFSSIWGYIKRLIWGPLHFVVSPLLFHHLHGNFALSLGINNETSTRILEEMERKNFDESPVRLNSIEIEEGKEIAIQFRCLQPADCRMEPEENKLLINENFVNRGSVMLPFTIDPSPKPGEVCRMLCIFTYSDKEEKYPFKLVWPEKQEVKFPEVRDSTFIIG